MNVNNRITQTKLSVLAFEKEKNTQMLHNLLVRLERGLSVKFPSKDWPPLVLLTHFSNDSLLASVEPAK